MIISRVGFRAQVVAGIILMCGYGCFLWLVLALVGCGYKTAPIAPGEAIPAAIEDLRFYQDENKVVLTWSYPKRTTAGSKLESIDSFLILRAVIPESDYCSGCPVSFTTAVEVAAEAALVEGKRRQASYTEMLLRPGHRYLYRVRTKIGRRLVSDDSNTVSFSWESPAEAPHGLVALAGDREVRLSWQPVTRLLNGSDVGPLLYLVYRSRTADTYQVVGDPVPGLTFIDSGLTNGQEYFYKVKAVQLRQQTEISGMTSRVVSASPRDLTAPTPLRELTVVKSRDGIKILWERGLEKDIAGYTVYRRSPAEVKPTAIGKVNSGSLFYVDQQAAPDKEWYYSVSAFDQADPANESTLSKEIFYEPF